MYVTSVATIYFLSSASIATAATLFSSSSSSSSLPPLRGNIFAPESATIQTPAAMPATEDDTLSSSSSFTCDPAEDKTKKKKSRPDDPVLDSMLREACDLQRRVGEGIMAPSAAAASSTTSTDGNEENNQYWAGIDLEHVLTSIRSNSHHDIYVDVGGGGGDGDALRARAHQVGWTSDKICAACVGGRDSEAYHEHHSGGGGDDDGGVAAGTGTGTTQRVVDHYGGVLSIGLLESLAAYFEDPASRAVYARYFGALPSLSSPSSSSSGRAGNTWRSEKQKDDNEREDTYAQEQRRERGERVESVCAPYLN